MGSMSHPVRQIAIQWHSGGRRGGMSGSHGHRQHRIGTQPRSCSVCRPNRSAARPAPVWSRASMPTIAWAMAPFTCCHRTLDAVTAKRLAAVAQVQRLAAAGRGARRVRSRGRRRRLPAGRRPQRSAGRGYPIRGGRARRRCWFRSCGYFLSPGLADLSQALRRIRQQRAGDAPDPILVRFARDVFDRRLAVHPRQQQSR